MNVASSRSQGTELKSPAEIELMRQAGRILAEVLAEVSAAVAEGGTTAELDKLGRSLIEKAGGKPSFLKLYGFPKSLCISVNEEVVHGIPGGRKLAKGDIVSLDCGVYYKGFHADSAVTVPVGEIAPEVQRLLKVTRESLERAIEQARVGNRLGDIGNAVQQCVESNGFHVIRDYGGHGIGRKVHEGPRLDNFGPAGQGARLQPGMVIAIEPMVAIGTGETEELRDGWTVVTKDRSMAAHFEHTVAITSDGPEILTRTG